MEIYTNGRQQQELKRGTTKRILRVLVIIAMLCCVLSVAFFIFGHYSPGHTKTNPNGSESLVYSAPETIPDYSGDDYIVLNGGKPCFNQWDIENITGEHYSELDGLGRCGCAYAMLDRTMMPAEERGEIGQIKPSGWKQRKYEGIIDSNPPYLYNRCHLIAYALTGQNANEQNLITGTGYMNTEIMLPWEEQVMMYLDNSDDHVLYRVTPYFKGREILARGVELEAYSVEDKGESLCFHVFIYNVQPGIAIDYSSGESRPME